MPPGSAPPSTFSADREIELLLRDALGGFGVAGIASVHSGQVELRAGGAPVSIDLENLAEQWPLLPHEIRRRRVGELARRLVNAQRGGVLRRGTRRGTGIISVPIAAMVLGLAGLIAGARWWFNRRVEPDVPAAIPVETEEQARARRGRVCDAARKRLYAGASIGPFDMEGWYAELWLARAKPGEDLRARPEIMTLVDGGKISVAAEPALSSLADGTVQIVEGFVPERAARSPGWSGVTIRFGGAYVGALLDTSLRPRFLSLADRLADALQADAGALYGRCAHLGHRDLGAWFRGADARSAAAALVYAAGMHAELPAVDTGALARLGGAGELDALRMAAAKLDVTALGHAVGPHGGTVTRDRKAVSVTFPMAGGTRATTASRSVARALGVGLPE
jgi:serine/threonine-protein kinase